MNGRKFLAVVVALLVSTIAGAETMIMQDGDKTVRLDNSMGQQHVIPSNTLKGAGLDDA